MNFGVFSFSFFYRFGKGLSGARHLRGGGGRAPTLKVEVDYPCHAGTGMSLMMLLWWRGSCGGLLTSCFECSLHKLPSCSHSPSSLAFLSVGFLQIVFDQFLENPFSYHSLTERERGFRLSQLNTLSLTFRLTPGFGRPHRFYARAVLNFLETRWFREPEEEQGQEKEDGQPSTEACGQGLGQVSRDAAGTTIK